MYTQTASLVVSLMSSMHRVHIHRIHPFSHSAYADVWNFPLKSMRNVHILLTSMQAHKLEDGIWSTSTCPQLFQAAINCYPLGVINTLDPVQLSIYKTQTRAIWINIPHSKYCMGYSNHFQSHADCFCNLHSFNGMYTSSVASDQNLWTMIIFKEEKNNPHTPANGLFFCHF